MESCKFDDEHAIAERDVLIRFLAASDYASLALRHPQSQRLKNQNKTHFKSVLAKCT